MSPFDRWLQDTLETETGDTVHDLRTDTDTFQPGGDSVVTADWTNGSGEPRHRRLVLRRADPNAPHPNGPHPDDPGPHDRHLGDSLAREAMTLAGVGLAGTVPIPRMLGVETGAELIGTPFMLIEHINGHQLVDAVSMQASEWSRTLSAEQGTRLRNSAMDALVGVHRIDWRSRHAFLLDGLDLERLLDRRLRQLHHRYRSVTTGRDFPITDEALRLLLDRRPEVIVREPVLTWGRAHIGNMIFGKRLTCVAVTNWASASIGTPEVDVAHWLVHDAVLRESSTAAQSEVWPDRAVTISDYQLRAGRTLSNLDFFELIEELELATDLIAQSNERDLPTGADSANGDVATRLIARRLNR